MPDHGTVTTTSRAKIEPFARLVDRLPVHHGLCFWDRVQAEWISEIFDPLPGHAPWLITPVYVSILTAKPSAKRGQCANTGSRSDAL